MTKRQVRFEPNLSATPGFDRAVTTAAPWLNPYKPVVGTVPLDVGQDAF